MALRIHAVQGNTFFAKSIPTVVTLFTDFPFSDEIENAYPLQSWHFDAVMGRGSPLHSLDNRVLRTLKFKTGSWLLLNFLIAALWLRIASSLWPEPGFEGCGPDGSDGITFLFLALPLYCAAMLGNLAALVMAIVCYFRRAGSVWLVVVLISSIVWLGVAGYAYDRNNWDPAKLCTR